MFVKLSERSWQAIRGYLVEMSTVILGILIALALGGLMERRAERKLAAEASQQIEGEMAANKKDLDGALATYPTTRQQLGQALKVLDQLIHDAETGTHTRGIGYSITPTSIGLSTTAMTTAESTGAMRYMDYADVRRYADVYGLQQIFMHQNDRLNDAYVDMVLVADLGHATAAELQSQRQVLAATLRYLTAVERYGRSLTKAYAGNIRAR